MAASIASTGTTKINQQPFNALRRLLLFISYTAAGMKIIFRVRRRRRRRPGLGKFDEFVAVCVLVLTEPRRPPRTY